MKTNINGQHVWVVGFHNDPNDCIHVSTSKFSIEDAIRKARKFMARPSTGLSKANVASVEYVGAIDT